MAKNETPFRPTPDPLDISVLVLPRASILEVASVLDPMRAANRHLGRQGFRWRVVSPDGAAVPLTCGIELPSTGPMAEATGDFLMVISGFGLAEVATPALVRGVARMAGRFSMVGGVDSAPWVLARAGLLTGHRATVHWEDLEDFAQAFPQIEVVPDRFVLSGNRVTVGGAAAAADLMLHLIGARCGRSVAGQVADSFLYDTGADPARPQRPGLLPGVRDRRLSQALTLMAQHLDEPLPLGVIAQRLGMGRRRLEQVFAQALGQSPAQAYLDQRLQAARRMIDDTTHPIAEIGLRVGFSDPSSFARAYKRRFGFSPKRQTKKV